MLCKLIITRCKGQYWAKQIIPYHIIVFNLTSSRKLREYQTSRFDIDLTFLLCIVDRFRPPVHPLFKLVLTASKLHRTAILMFLFLSFVSFVCKLSMCVINGLTRCSCVLSTNYHLGSLQNRIWWWEYENLVLRNLVSMHQALVGGCMMHEPFDSPV